MKFVEPSHFTDPDAAARKLVEIANATEAVQYGRIHIELVNGPFRGRWHARWGWVWAAAPSCAYC
jgi:hypothetical protein